MIKVDLHTHSIASRDGGIKPAQYKAVLESGQLDCIAVTDHNRIDMALELHKSLGSKIIVGEEINTTDGELIGLFLSHKVEPGQHPRQTAEAIKAQGGLVYAPHPFETVRSGLSLKKLTGIGDLVDIVETLNGRAVFQNRGTQAAGWAKSRFKPMAASSDAHGYKGLGTTYTKLSEIPTANNLLSLLYKAQLVSKRPPLHTLLHPKFNRIRKRVGKKP
ncbi:MAG TPA: PHP-associated domain-containing protein [Candidatus Saccharimonadales bacterium]|nr:PHP-associated domain-containing protein [Candidatus Saccharimonadales bacterium]